MQFNEFNLSKELLSSIEKLGISEPTQIQQQSIPFIINGDDVIGESATGSGKTLAFGCGIIEKVVPRQGLQALVLTPTRELAEQVKESLRKLTQMLSIITVYGGVNIDAQIKNLPKADIVVGTPGRMLDHIERRTINLSKIKLIVLDEADRMLDMGFIDDVERIMKECPKKRQTLFFSATIAPAIKELSKRYMFNPKKVSATKMVDASKLKQVYYDVSKNMKFSLLAHLLKKESSGLVLVFCNTRMNVDFVAKNLRNNKIDAIAIHGGFSQNKRNKTLQTFSDKKAHVLVCTDVVARGLHIENVSHVYNYDIPKDPKDYVHRIGRTARAGEEGKAVSLLCDFDHENYARVRREYREFKINNVEIPPIERAIVDLERSNRNNGSGRNRGGGFRRNSNQFRGNGVGRERTSNNRRPPARGGFNNRNNRKF